mgnify:CR=1 FL=1
MFVLGVVFIISSGIIKTEDIFLVFFKLRIIIAYFIASRNKTAFQADGKTLCIGDLAAQNLDLSKIVICEIQLASGNRGLNPNGLAVAAVYSTRDYGRYVILMTQSQYVSYLMYKG